MRPRLTAVASALLALVLFGALASSAPAATSHSIDALRPPHRIVSLSPTATEMLFAIGAGKQVKAVDDQSDFPKNAPRTKLSGFEPNVEAIAGYEPDLVVVSDSGVADQLHSLGVQVLVLPAANRLSESYDQITQLGTITGHKAEAKKLVARIKHDLAAIAKDVPARAAAPKVYYELDDTYFSADSTTFIGRLLKMAGLDNIADAGPGGGSGYPQLSAEYIVDSNPAVIFLADTKCCHQIPRTVAKRPGFADVAAVKGHHVIALNDDIASRWGPRVVQLFRDIVKATKAL